MLEFAKKFFFSDDNIDKDDPFSLHLLYVESNRAIIEGKYPVTRIDAKDFGALQMQIVFGDHDAAKHKPGFFKCVLSTSSTINTVFSSGLPSTVLSFYSLFKACGLSGHSFSSFLRLSPSRPHSRPPYLHPHYHPPFTLTLPVTLS